MSTFLDWMDGFFLKMEQNVSWAWEELVIAERQHPVLLAIATLIVIFWALSVCCGWCCKNKRPVYVIMSQQPATSYGAVQQNKPKRPSL